MSDHRDHFHLLRPPGMILYLAEMRRSMHPSGKLIWAPEGDLRNLQRHIQASGIFPSRLVEKLGWSCPAKTGEHIRVHQRQKICPARDAVQHHFRHTLHSLPTVNPRFRHQHCRDRVFLPPRLQRHHQHQICQQHQFHHSMVGPTSPSRQAWKRSTP